MFLLGFPLLLVPRLGLVRTSLFFGLCNAGVGLWATIANSCWVAHGTTNITFKYNMP